MHPHSGIATVTAVLDGAFAYRESIGAHGDLPTGGVEFMSAGGGVWHQGMLRTALRCAVSSCGLR